jgi:hypothetical protein
MLSLTLTLSRRERVSYICPWEVEDLLSRRERVSYICPWEVEDLLSRRERGLPPFSPREKGWG